MSLIKYLPVLDITDLPGPIKQALYASNHGEVHNDSFITLDISEYRAYKREDAMLDYKMCMGSSMVKVMEFLEPLTSEDSILVKYWW